MIEDRTYHGCSRVARKGHDYLVVMGGWKGSTSTFLSSIEFYDMTVQPSAWEIVSGISLPTALGNIMGSVTMKLDDNFCDVMLISNTTRRLHQCSGNYEWTDFDLALNITNGLKKMAVIDANLLF
jgi:hypothetical protein